MDELRRLDAVSRFKFGVLCVGGDNKISYLKFGFDRNLYILTDAAETALITVKPRGGKNVVFRMDEEFDWELDSGVTYYMKPPPTASVDLDLFDVQRYALADALGVNFNSSNQLDYIEERFIDVLKTTIGRKKLRMSCWPFTHISLTTFLQDCCIPHDIVICRDDKCYLFDGDQDICTDVENFYNPREVFVEMENVTTDGQLFCNCKCFRKRVYCNFKEMVFNGSSMTSGSSDYKIEIEDVFIIFNPISTTNGANETVLPGTGNCVETVF